MPYCGCDDGYYDNVACLPCSGSNPNYKTCYYTTVVIPTTCLGNNRNISNDCNCQEGFFGAADGSDCTICNSTCKTCSTTADNCDTCESPRTKSGTKCNCPTGYHDEDGASRFCIKCPRFCASCLNSAGSCTDCIAAVGSSNSYRNITNECKCSSGFTDWGLLD